jgi:hypothetical protein
MKDITLKNWDEFQQEIDKLESETEVKKATSQSHVSNLIFRGQSNYKWNLETTLERYIEDELSLKDYHKIILIAQNRIETFTNKKWEVPSIEKIYEWHNKSSKVFIYDMPGYNYIAYLRHHGFPSPLLDWSISPYIASFFAFNNADRKNEYVSIYAYLEYSGGAKISSGDESHMISFGENIKCHERHYLQQSNYTLCTKVIEDEILFAKHQDFANQNVENQDLVWKFNIPVEEKVRVLRQLDKYNINAYSLFSSEESLIETIALREFLTNKHYK